MRRRPGCRFPTATPTRRSARPRARRFTTWWRRRRAFSRTALHGADGGKARAYLRERGLSPEIQKRFRIGYAPASRNALKEHLAAADIAQEQMIEAGLLIAGDDIPVSYDRFRDRIIFPITDFRGRVIAFGGRALSPDAQAKYLNSPETPLFHKSHVLYNGQAARAASRKGGHVIAVEGYIDVIACVAAGFEATVAPLGTALTEDQLRMLWQMAEEPVLCFDGDEAGLKAAFRAVHLALAELKPGKSVRFALLPGGQDPDDLIRAEGTGAVPQDPRCREAARRHAVAERRPTGSTSRRRSAGRVWSRRFALRSRRSPISTSGGTTRPRSRSGWHCTSARRGDPRSVPAINISGTTGVAPASGAFQPAPPGPSASLLAHPLVRGGARRRPEPCRRDPCRRADSLPGDRGGTAGNARPTAQFAGKELAELAAALAARTRRESPGISAAELRSAA